MKHDMLEITPAPRDYISDLIILGDRSLIAVTCWDGSITIYEYAADRAVELKVRLVHQYALTSCCYVTTLLGSKLYAGSVQGEILEVDLELNRFRTVQNSIAQLGISDMCQYRSSIICGSWDGWIQAVDCDTNSVVTHTKLPEDQKVLSMDANEDKLIVAATGNTTRWFQLPLKDESGFEAESGLKYQARKIKLIPAGDGYVSSSLDGRVAVEYFDDDSRKFAFRCHRMNLVDTSFVFPVNALAFVPGETTLYTGGSDGYVSCWNLDTRKKIEQLPKFNEDSVVHLACSRQILVVATSDDSFKTNAIINDDSTPLLPSRLYILYL